MDDGEMYVPYSSYFNPEKISVTVPCELKYHDVKYGQRPTKTAKTSWINYVFEDAQGKKYANYIQPRYSLRRFMAVEPL